MGERVLVRADSLEYEISETNSCLQKYIDGANSSLVALNDYCTESELRGEAYESSQRYFQNTYIPMLEQVISICSEIISVNNTIMPLFSQYVPNTTGFEADTLVLEDKIEQLKSENRELERKIEELINFMTKKPFFAIPYAHSGLLKAYGDKIDVNNRLIQRLQEIIDGLRAFNSASVGIYTEANALIVKLKDLVNVLSTDRGWNGITRRLVAPGVFNEKLVELEYERIWTVDGLLDIEQINKIMSSDVERLSVQRLIALGKAIDNIKLIGGEEQLSQFISSCYINPRSVEVPDMGYCTRYDLSPLAQQFIVYYTFKCMEELHSNNINVSLEYDKNTHLAKYYEMVAKAGLLYSIFDSPTVSGLEIKPCEDEYSKLRIKIVQRQNMDGEDIIGNFNEFFKCAKGAGENRPYDYVLTILGTEKISEVTYRNIYSEEGVYERDVPKSEYPQYFISQMVNGRSGRGREYSRHLSEKTIQQLIGESTLKDDVALSVTSEVANILIDASKGFPSALLPGLSVAMAVSDAIQDENERKEKVRLGKSAINFSQYEGVADAVGLNYLPIFNSDGTAEIPISHLSVEAEYEFVEWFNTKKGEDYTGNKEQWSKYIKQLQSNTFDVSEEFWKQFGYGGGHSGNEDK